MSHRIKRPFSWWRGSDRHPWETIAWLVVTRIERKGLHCSGNDGQVPVVLPAQVLWEKKRECMFTSQLTAASIQGSAMHVTPKVAYHPISLTLDSNCWINELLDCWSSPYWPLFSKELDKRRRKKTGVICSVLYVAINNLVRSSLGQRGHFSK